MHIQESTLGCLVRCSFHPFSLLLYHSFFSFFPFVIERFENLQQIKWPRKTNVEKKQRHVWNKRKIQATHFRLSTFSMGESERRRRSRIENSKNNSNYKHAHTCTRHTHEWTTSTQTNINAHFTTLYRGAFNLIFIVCFAVVVAAAAVVVVVVADVVNHVLNARTRSLFHTRQFHQKSTFKSHSSDSHCNNSRFSSAALTLYLHSLSFHRHKHTLAIMTS